MFKRIFFFIGVALSSGAWSSTASSSIPPLNILFIGNSLTYVNDLPGSLKAIAAAEGRTITTTMQAFGGWTLAMHDADAGTNALISGGGWDYVVLQEQSSTSVDNFPAFHAAVASLDAKIKAAGARTVLYHNWPLNTQPGRFNEYQSAFGSTASDFCAAWAEAGDAWWLVYQDSVPTWAALYSDDRHPTAKGTYLTACVFYDTFYGESPVQTDPVLGLNAADSAYYQAKALAAVSAFQAGMSVASFSPTADEQGLQSASFVVSNDVADTICDTPIYYTVSGTAIAGFDYTTLSGRVDIPVGARSVTVTVLPLADGVADGDKILNITLWGGPFYRRVLSSVDLTIKDLPAPSPTPTLSPTPSVTEVPTLGPSPTATASPTPLSTLAAGEGTLLGLLAAPNPGMGEAWISFQSDGRVRMQVKVYSSALAVVHAQQVELGGAGWHRVRLEARGLAQGLYTVTANGKRCTLYLLQ